LAAWMNERSYIANILASLSIIAVIATVNIAPGWFKPLGRFYYEIYSGNLLYLFLLVLFAAGLVFWLFRYMLNRFYLDGKIKSGKTESVAGPGLDFMDKYGMTGAFVRNDIRLILRNTRAKMILQSSFFILIFAAFIFYMPMYKDNNFMYAFMAMSITAVFLMNFGSFVPAWDSEYFKLLMSQSIRYREYLEAKWWLMVISVGIMSVLSIPFMYFGTDIYKMIIAFAFLNVGLNTYLVLFTGLINTTPIKLNEKVSSFGGGQGFNAKMFLLSLIRFAVPLALYFILVNFYDIDTVLIVFALTGITGVVLKNYILDKLADFYNRRKYVLIEAYSAGED
jgi:hypothetical protein